jgi:hypothetical protein
MDPRDQVDQLAQARRVDRRATIEQYVGNKKARHCRALTNVGFDHFDRLASIDISDSKVAIGLRRLLFCLPDEGLLDECLPKSAYLKSA